MIFSPENLFMVWTTIGKQCFESGDQINNNEFMESATSALRAITQKLQDAKAAAFLQVKNLLKIFNKIRQIITKFCLVGVE